MRYATIILGVALANVGAARAEVKVESSTEYYSVRASSALEAVRYIKNFGPLEVFVKGERAAGLTNWKIAHSGFPRLDSDGCGTKSVLITVTTKVTLPQLYDNSMRKKERDFVEGKWRQLAEHENGHFQIAIDTAKQIDAELTELRAANCNEIPNEV